VVAKLLSYSNLQIQSLHWILTEASQKELVSETHKEAMRDAVQKANDYSDIIGRKVIDVAIYDGEGRIPGPQKYSGGQALGFILLRNNTTIF
jgi:uncharacterized protein YggE